MEYIFDLRKFSAKLHRRSMAGHLIASLNYAVLVRNFILRGNNNSMVRISNMLMAVVAIILIRKLRNVPNDNHSSNVKYP
jgi:hypothetical protein